MSFCGVTDIPTFDNPNPADAIPKPGEVGYACRGKQIEPCRAFLQKYSRDRPVDDAVMLSTLCASCKGKER